MGEFWGLDGVNGFAAFNFSIYIAIRLTIVPRNAAQVEGGVSSIKCI